MPGYTVERHHSGTEDGYLWYVIAPDGKTDGGWLYREHADQNATFMNCDYCQEIDHVMQNGGTIPTDTERCSCGIAERS